MRSLTPNALAGLVLDALERTAFVLAEPAADGAAGAATAPWYVSRVDFAGPQCGRVVLAASDGFARELAAGLLGIEPEEVDPGQQGRQAIDELANILGGSVVLALGGDEQPFRLGLPAPADAATIDECRRSSIRAGVVSEFGTLDVCVLPRASAGEVDLRQAG